MTNNNVNVVREYIEQVINQKYFDRMFDFCTQDCVSHSHPYVGLGVNFDDTSGERLILKQVAPGGPADGHLEIGDELIRVRDGEHEWETFHDLRNGLWAQGVVNTELAMTVRRHGNLLTIPLTRSRIEAFDMRLADESAWFAQYINKFWPDLHCEIRTIFSGDDTVACYMVNSGTQTEYNRSAVWGEIDIFKMRNGKISEMWGVENTYSQLKQLGFQVTEPVREMA